MGELPRTRADGTLGVLEGFPYRIASTTTADGPHVVRVGLAAMALGLAVFALFGSLTFAPMPGVLADDSGGVVRSVDPAGFAWRDGIRPGQLVLAVSAADEPDGWKIETMDAAGVDRISSITGVQAVADRTATLALLALVIAAAGLMLAVAASPASGLAVAAGAGLAAIPLTVVGDGLVAWVGLALAAVIAGGRLAVDLGSRALRLLVLAATIGAVGVSLISRTVNPAAADSPDPLWVLVIASVCGVGLIWARRSRVHDRPTSRVRLIAELIAPAALASLLVMAGLFGAMQWQIAAVGAIVVCIASPSVRTGIAGLLDTTWLAGIRRSASINALDEERSRVAADLHDAPLQGIAGVIARLENVPAVDHERQALRTVSDQLRELVTGLEPPMLDQLGLVPALDYVVAQQRQGQQGPTVTIAVHADVTRPPHAVEVAAYRIAEEALRNAVHHSHASHVVISGEVFGDHLAMSVADDGDGVGQAQARGGLASMPARARAVGGKIRCLPGTNGGTVIAFEWQAR